MSVRISANDWVPGGMTPTTQPTSRVSSRRQAPT